MWGSWLAIVGTLAACGSAPVATRAPVESPRSPAVSAPAVVNAPALVQARSRWVPVPWETLPGWGSDSLFEAWNAWLKSCEKPQPPLAALCGDVRRLSIGSPQEQMEWMQSRLQPHRVETPQGEATGLLTSYYEPILEATRLPTSKSMVPLYQMPRNLALKKPWFTRQEIETDLEAQSALKDRAIAYLADPVDATILQIQGTGRIKITEPNGSVSYVRLAFAGSNEHTYKPISRWLLDQGLIKDASWPGIKAWIAQNPQRLQELLWVNPRYVFFKEEQLTSLDAAFGPRGAQGVALTPGRSIAVDPGSIPYGAPVWLASNGNQTNLQKLVLAQDTGSAITGAVRADYFAGWGPEAAELAGRMRQPLQMWILWPK